MEPSPLPFKLWTDFRQTCLTTRLRQTEVVCLSLICVVCQVWKANIIVVHLCNYSICVVCQVWNVERGTLMRMFEEEHEEQVNHCQFTNTRRRLLLATCSNDKFMNTKVCLWCVCGVFVCLPLCTCETFKIKSKFFGGLHRFADVIAGGANFFVFLAPTVQ